MLALCVTVAAVFDSCPWECPGTAIDRKSAAQQAATSIDLNGEWSLVREALVNACGLRVDGSTSHCFEDFNHVDCCTMASDSTHRTNEESLVPGMHRVNLLGPHITQASLASLGPGGSWCT